MIQAVVNNMKTPHNESSKYKAVYEDIIPQLDVELYSEIGQNSTYSKVDILSEIYYISPHGYLYEGWKKYLEVSVNVDVADADTVLRRLKQPDLENMMFSPP